MLKKFFFIIIIFVACFSCGKKGDPEYKSFFQENYKIKTI